MSTTTETVTSTTASVLPCSWLPFATTLQAWMDLPCLHDITFYLYVLASTAGLLWMGMLLFCSSQRFLAAWMITLIIIMMVAWFLIAGHITTSLLVKTTGYIWIGVFFASVLSTFYSMYCAFSYHKDQNSYQTAVWNTPSLRS